MGRGNSLTDHEKGMIDAFEKDGHSQREIDKKKINRSRCAVNNYIKNQALVGCIPIASVAVHLNLKS